MSAPLLPPPLRGWPVILRAGPPDAPRHDPDSVAAALVQIRAERLFWPAPRRAAQSARVAAFGREGRRAARKAGDTALMLRDPADLHPGALKILYGAPASVALWAALGGVATPDRPAAEPMELLSRAVAVSPWTGERLDLGSALDAQALLMRAALRSAGPIGLLGMSARKRRFLRPFLIGPDGAPRRLASARAAAAHPGPVVVWGASARPFGPEPARDRLLRAEDGFLRSVGLGLLRTPPLSLSIYPGPPHFDAAGPTAFERIAANTVYDDTLLRRAAALRRRITNLRLTKYNIGARRALPDPGGRMALLVAGQVEDDAAVRFGATTIRTNLKLLLAARRRFPDAALVYKPHPDVETGLRPGRVHRADAMRIVDYVAEDASAADCLDWADRVAVITSLIGFEALLRETPVICFGRPFYAGWGLTEDVDPPARPRSLSLDELTAAALILYPFYVDPGSGLPAPPEIVVEALAGRKPPGPGLLGRLTGALRARRAQP